jgi:hypothetical protein
LFLGKKKILNSAQKLNLFKTYVYYIKLLRKVKLILLLYSSSLWILFPLKGVKFFFGANEFYCAVV